MPKKGEVTGGKKKCRAMSLLIFTVHQLLIRMIESIRVWYGACSGHGSEKLNAIIHLENLILVRSKVGCECVDRVYLV